MALNHKKNYKNVKASEVEITEEKLVNIRRVAKVTQGGRVFSTSAIVVVGNRSTHVVGYGLGTAKEVVGAVTKGTDSAKKSLVAINVIKGTIPHATSAKFGGAEVFIRPAAPGSGIVAGGAMRAVLESVGITDILAKSKGSSSPHNVVKATQKALLKLRTPKMIAKQRGVTLDKLFNG